MAGLFTRDLMKIAHIIQSLDPGAGGPPIVAANLAAAQSALGCETMIVGYERPDARERISAAYKTTPHFEDVKLEYLPSPNRVERIFARGARRQLGPILRDFDLIHLHGVWDPILYAAADVAGKFAKPYVITFHGMLDPWSLRQKALKKKLALALGYKRMINEAAFLHYINLDEQRLTEPLHLKPPAKVVANGIFLEQIDPLPERGSFRAEHPELSGAPMILFLSRLHFKKGLDVLADAFAIVSREFPEARLVVAGPDDGARGDFETQIARLGIGGRASLVGPIYGPGK